MEVDKHTFVLPVPTQRPLKVLWDGHVLTHELHLILAQNSQHLQPL